MVKRGWIDYLIYAIWAFIFFVGIYDLFHIPARSIFWFGELILALFIYYKLKVPNLVYLGIMLVFLANIFGELFFGLFYIMPNFDKWIHLLSPMVACTLFYFLFKKKIKDKKMLIFFSVTLILAWSVAWEIIEYFSDQYFHTLLVGVHLTGLENFNLDAQYMGPLKDTIYDMFYGLIGSVVWAAIALFLVRKKIPSNNKK
ncbi:MAG: hypothetical protein KKB62_02905 [Nanoarchaeota archaeon]|nr:hypothetical protein [Nanoarchaeota archaeon]